MTNDLVGPARKVQAIIDNAIHQAKANGNEPLAFLFYGPPGTGKSSLAAYFAQRLQLTRWSVTKLSGTQCRIETVEDIARSMHFTDMFGNYRLIWIDEVDNMPRVAQVRFLTLMDDLPYKTAVVCTCNAKINDLEERFQRRFQAIQVKGPSVHEIAELLKTRMRVPGETANYIAELSCGNVGQAINDAKTFLNTVAV